MKKYKIIESSEDLEIILKRVREAQEKFSKYSQKQVDEIFKAAAISANKARIRLAQMAVDETKMGVVEDKVVKNHLACEYIYNKYKNEKTCGVIYEDNSSGIQKIACPIGVIGAVIPTTNPTSTTIFKILLALKTRNGIIISPHPRAKDCTSETARIMLEAAIEAGAPEDIIAWIDKPSLDITRHLMSSSDIILATGGPDLVKAAYSSGRPAIGVGAGNTPAIIDDSANILMAVSSIIHSKSFDNGMICASEQAVIVLDSIYDEVKNEFIKRGCHFLADDELERLRGIILVNGSLNSKIVGQSASKIAQMAGISINKGVKLLIGEVENADICEALAHEKLSPILAMYRANSFDDALDIAEKLIEIGGLGHTSSVYLNEISETEKINKFKHRMKTCRALINTPSSQGGVGDVYNFSLPPSFTLGCGSWGGNSISENVGSKHLLNIKIVAMRRENMLWLKAPESIYFKRGSLPYALEAIKDEMEKKRAFIVTDTFLFENGYVNPIIEKLSSMGIQYSVFSGVEPDPTLECARNGAEQMKGFSPDVIIAFGGGSAMDAAKIMWMLYEHPYESFESMSLRFSDIRKRIYSFPKMGKRASLVAIPTSSGTGSEVTPFAVITDEKTGIKYPLADYELLPNVAIIDVDLHMSAPKSLTSASGIDALTHALEAYVSIMSSDFTDSMALKSIEMIFKYLPRAYENGNDIEAREKMANSAALAGIAFANAFLGICHSMAHKLGSFHHLPHGIANALLIEQVIRFNANEAPTIMGTFSQYDHPMSLEKYAEIADYLGLAGKTQVEKLEALIKAIRELKFKIGIKASIKEYGIDESTFLSTLDKMSIEAFDDQCTGANPRYPLISEIRAMYLNAYYGKDEPV